MAVTRMMRFSAPAGSSMRDHVAPGYRVIFCFLPSPHHTRIAGGLAFSTAVAPRGHADQRGPRAVVQGTHGSPGNVTKGDAGRTWRTTAPRRHRGRSMSLKGGPGRR